MSVLPWDGGPLQALAEQAAVWLLNVLAPQGACTCAAPGEYLLTAGALVLSSVASSSSTLARCVTELFDLPFELAYA
eukprot:12782227-Alexandrium_andersonii.AAC.1